MGSSWPWLVWITGGVRAGGREPHLAFCATNCDAVDAVRDPAVTAGAEVLHAPREWPQYHPGYGVFLRNLDGHNVETVYHGN